MNTSRVLTALILGSMLTLTGCKKEETAAPSVATITAGDVAKTWTSGCNAGSDPVTGATKYKTTLTLGADNSFSSMQLWYASGNCTGQYLVVYLTSGVFSVGGTANLFGISFGVANSSVYAMVDATQSAFNTACTNTSPYISGVDSLQNGVAKSSYGSMNCMGMTFANSSAAEWVNIGSLSGGVLTLGDSGLVGLPGADVNSGAPNAVSVSYQ